MLDAGRLLCLTIGLICGSLSAYLCVGPVRPALAAADHFEDYILCTGAVAADFKSSARWNPSSHAYQWHHEEVPIEGVWLLDYRSGKLLGTAIDRTAGKVVGWAEVDLLPEFELAPRQNVHFTMTTGAVGIGQAALYVVETTSGKMAVYTMGPRPDGARGIVIRRHDRVPFRKPAA